MSISANIIEQAFSPLIGLFESIMVFIHAHIVGGSWGLAIVGLTVLIRAVLVPLTYKQLKSMQEMQRLSPQIQALKEKYKEDKQRQQQEIMKFYKDNKINPLASCLPLVMQLPVFISLFYMLRTDLKKNICGPALRAHFHVLHNSQIPSKGLEKIGCNQVAPHSAKFLFLPDITSKATGVALVVLIALYVGSQLGSTLIATATADPNQRRLMLLLPLVFIVILYRYPAGLLVYWITTNLWTIGQQYLIRRRLPPPPRPTAAANGKPSRSLRQALAAATSGATAGAAQPEVAGAGGGVSTGAPPPRSPRKKKKRSGRRR
jgi:YidC/Oxa1 family membrane protein insertase